MIIDFAFSVVDHTCPEWRECDELEDVWRELELERFVTVQLVVGIVSGLLVILLIYFTRSAYPPVVGLPVD